MTVSVQSNKNVFNGDGSTDNFTWTFQLPAGSNGSEILVFVIDNLGNVTQLGSNYTVDLNLSKILYPLQGGLAPLGVGVNALPAGWQLALYRVESIVQGLNLNTSGPFPASSIMAQLDYLTMVCQQLNEMLGRAILYPIGQAPTSTNVNAFITAITAAIASTILPPIVIGTYAALKAASVAAAATMRFGFATDLGTAGQLMFYCGNTSVGDQGWIAIGGG